MDAHVGVIPESLLNVYKKFVQFLIWVDYIFIVVQISDQHINVLFSSIVDLNALEFGSSFF